MAKGKSTASTDLLDANIIDDTFQASQEEAEKLYSFTDRVTTRLKKIGIGEAPRPKLEEEHTAIFAGSKAGTYFDGRLPTVTRKLTLDQLSDLLSLMLGWYDYVSQQAMNVETELSEAKRQKEFAWAMVRSRISDQAKKNGVSLNPARVADLARLDSRFVHVDSKFIELQVLGRCVAAMLRAAGHNLKTISREITVRQVKVDSESRGRGLGSSMSALLERAAVRYNRSTQDHRLHTSEEDQESILHEEEETEDEDRPAPKPKKPKVSKSVTVEKKPSPGRPKLHLRR